MNGRSGRNAPRVTELGRRHRRELGAKVVLGADIAADSQHLASVRALPDHTVAGRESRYVEMERGDEQCAGDP